MMREERSRESLKEREFPRRIFWRALKKNEKNYIKRLMQKKVVRVFLDSNVILSGLLSEKGSPRILLDLLSLRLPSLAGDRGGSTGKYNLIEIERNLKEKIPGLLPLFKVYLPKLNLKVMPLPRSEDVKDFSGQIAEKDVPVLISAIQSKAEFLVTGDKRHFGKMKGLGEYPFEIVTPSEFIDSILPEILKRLEPLPPLALSNP